MSFKHQVKIAKSVIFLKDFSLQGGPYRNLTLKNDHQVSNVNPSVRVQLVQSPRIVNINNNDAVIEYVKNVNDKQRDPENSHLQNVQGDKSELEDNAVTTSVLPIVKVNNYYSLYSKSK